MPCSVPRCSDGSVWAPMGRSGCPSGTGAARSSPATTSQRAPRDEEKHHKLSAVHSSSKISWSDLVKSCCNNFDGQRYVSSFKQIRNKAMNLNVSSFSKLITFSCQGWLSAFGNRKSRYHVWGRVPSNMESGYLKSYRFKSYKSARDKDSERLWCDKELIGIARYC